MTIEIHQLELEVLPAQVSRARNLVELFDPIRGVLTDEEVDAMFGRNPSPSRPVDLS